MGLLAERECVGVQRRVDGLGRKIEGPRRKVRPDFDGRACFVMHQSPSSIELNGTGERKHPLRLPVQVADLN